MLSFCLNDFIICNETTSRPSNTMRSLSTRCLLLLGFCALIAAEAVDATTQSRAEVFPRHVDDATGEKVHCQTPRASNFYGIGVRIGIYFAQAQALIANNFLSREIASAADRNTIFLIALTVALIKCTISGMVEQLDGLILMHMCGGTMFSVLTIWGYRTQRYAREGQGAIRNFGGFGTHSRLVISAIISGYGVWYWTMGITGSLDPMGPHDDPPNPVECAELYTFMFAKVPVMGPIRYFYAVWWGFWTLFFTIQMFCSSLAGYVKIVLVSRLTRKKDYAGQSKLKFHPGFTTNELCFIYRYVRFINVVWLIFSILAVEFTLNFNHVLSVLGGPNSMISLPTQLLPLLIGVFGFVRVVWLKVKELRSFDAVPAQREENVSMRSDRTIRNSANVLQLFSPALASYSPPEYKTETPGGEVMDSAARSPLVRYLYAWLPWLSLLWQIGEGGFEPTRPDEEKSGMMDARRDGKESMPGDDDDRDDSSEKGLMVPDPTQRYEPHAYRPQSADSEREWRRDAVERRV